jgi:hypothetical protein
MTANELADKLDLVRIELTIQASAMLRQQQAEIEKLKGIVENTIKQAFYEDNFHRLEKEIEALKLRELTEWEIKKCWEEATEMREHFCSQYFDFAQLILKKASEK